MNITYYKYSIKGRRDQNQDSCIALNLGNDRYFFAVADGMGGTSGGKIASSAIIKRAEQIIKEETKTINDPRELKDALHRVFAEAQKVIRCRIHDDPALEGMGSTLSCLLISGNKYVWGNLGDSRIYHSCQSKIQQISVDHTLIQDYLNTSKSGKIPESIISTYNNYLLRSVDGGADLPDIFPEDKDYEILKRDNLFLLCSDGLITNRNSADNKFLDDHLTKYNDLKELARKMAKKAYLDGSQDNITVVLIKANESVQNEIQTQTGEIKLNNRNKQLFIIMFVVLTLLILILMSINNY